MYAASALAANTIIRSAVGGAFPLFTDQFFNRLGIQWACTLIVRCDIVWQRDIANLCVTIGLSGYSDCTGAHLFLPSRR